jgi:hypothetical protein
MILIAQNADCTVVAAGLQADLALENIAAVAQQAAVEAAASTHRTR